MTHSRIVSFLQLLFVLLLGAIPARIQANNDTWKFGFSSNWETGGAWTDGSTPVGTDTATLGFASTYTVTFGVAPVAIQNLTVNNGGAVTFTSSGGAKTLNVTSATGVQELDLGTGTSLTLGTSGNILNLVAGTNISALSGSNLLVTNGSHMTAVDFSTNGLGGAIVVNGAGSLLTLTGTGEHFVGGSNGSGSITLQNSSASAVISGVLGIADSSVAATGSVTLAGNSTVSLASDLKLAAVSVAGSSGTLNIAGATTAFTQPGLGTVAVGSFSNGSASITVGGTTSATLTTGTGGMTIRSTGSVNVGSVSTFGTLNVNGDLSISGGGAGTGLTIAANSTFTHAAGRSVFLQSGGVLTLNAEYFTPAGQNYSIDGAGSKLQVNNSDFVLGNNAFTNVTNGGTLSGNYLSIGTNGNGTLTVDGGGSTAIATTGFSSFGLSHSTATVTFSNSGTGSFPGGLQLAGSLYGDTTANVLVKTGGHLSAGLLTIANATVESPTATLTVRDPGSTLTISPSGLLQLSGSSVPGNATLNILDNGTVTVGSGGTTYLYAGAILNINGGSADLKSLIYGGGTVNFTTGSLTYVGDLLVGFGGLLGTDLTLASNRILTLSGTTTVDPFRTLTLSGGTLNTGSMSINGTFNFISGNLGITGGLTIGNGNQLGANVTLTSGQKLTVTGGAAINANGTLYLNGGNFTSDGLNNTGVIQIGSPASSLTGSTIVNNGTLQGAGSVAAPVTNNVSIEATGGTLIFTGAVTNPGTIFASAGNKVLMQGISSFPTNAGLIELSGGTFDNGGHSLNNTGSITGYGTFRTGGTGLTNNGLILFTGGTTTVFGNLTNAAGKTINVEFQPAIFVGNITNNGTIKVTGTTITWTGTYGGNNYTSDPATNIFQNDVTVFPGGLMTGGPGDVFKFSTGTVTINGSFINGGTIQSSSPVINNGTFTQSGPQIWSVGTTFTNTGTASFLSDAGSAAASPLNITVNAGTVTLASNEHLNNLTINAGTTTLQSGTTKVSRLTFTSSAIGQLDLRNNAFIVEATAGTKASILQQLAGDIHLSSLPNITSSTALTDPNWTVALVDNADLGLTTFGGLAVDANSLLIVQALKGDADLNGIVDGADFDRWFGHNGSTAVYSYARGDFDGNGIVDGADFDVWFGHNGLVDHIGPSAINGGSLGTGGALSNTGDLTTTGNGLGAGSPASTPVPEPTTLCLLVPAFALLFRKRLNANPPGLMAH